MSDIPLLPFYVDDFESATAHLTIEEDGAYNRLLRLCWRTPGCSIPSDAQWIARKMRVDIPTFERVVKPILSEFFTHQKGRYFQNRLSAEYEFAKVKIERRKVAGKKGGIANALKKSDFKPSNASVLLDENPSKRVASIPIPIPIPIPSLEEEKTNATALAKKSDRGCKLPINFVPDLTPGTHEIVSHWAAGEFETELANFRDYHANKGTIGKDWQAGFRTWIRNREKFRSNGHGHIRNGSGPRNGNGSSNGFLAACDEALDNLGRAETGQANDRGRGESASHLVRKP